MAGILELKYVYTQYLSSDLGEPLRTSMIES